MDPDFAQIVQVGLPALSTFLGEAASLVATWANAKQENDAAAVAAVEADMVAAYTKVMATLGSFEARLDATDAAVMDEVKAE